MNLTLAFLFFNPAHGDPSSSPRQVGHCSHIAYHSLLPWYNYKKGLKCVAQGMAMARSAVFTAEEIVAAVAVTMEVEATVSTIEEAMATVAISATEEVMTAVVVMNS